MTLTDQERITRLELVVGRLLQQLQDAAIYESQRKELIETLTDDDPYSVPAYSRKKAQKP